MTNNPPYKRHLFVCMHERDADHPRGCCASKGAGELVKRFKELTKELKLAPEIRTQKSGCLNACERGISIVVYPEAVWYGGVTLSDVDEIVNSHLKNGQPVKRLMVNN